VWMRGHFAFQPGLLELVPLGPERKLTMTEVKTQPMDELVEALRNSPIHNLRPIDENPLDIDIDAVEIDATNPGSQTKSLRYARREESMRDSLDILGRIVYPIVVCQKQDNANAYIHVDGFGRLDQLKARGHTKIRAFVYPPLSLEQRILLRETLNSAQEPFDVASIIRDLQELALQRNLDIRNESHIKTLVRDLPERVRRRELDLVKLARWDPETVSRVGESYGSSAAFIGIDKLRELTKILDIMSARHPELMRYFGGEMALSKKLGQMYLDKKFQRGRSQTGIRRVVEALRTFPENDPAIRDYFRDERDYQALPPTEQPRDPVKLCEDLTRALLTLDVNSLTEEQRITLTRTRAVLNEVLS